MNKLKLTKRTLPMHLIS